MSLALLVSLRKRYNKKGISEIARLHGGVAVEEGEAAKERESLLVIRFVPVRAFLPFICARGKDDAITGTSG